jgi:HPt (histidine-containing phosphotransfer) domain-containing protein
LSKKRLIEDKTAKRFVNHLMIGWQESRARIDRRQGLKVITMSLHLERIDWMPSPPLAPDDGPIDMAHLKRVTLADISLEREVLAMFAGQSAGLIGALATLPPDAATLVHTLKGSARAIGAVRVAEAAEALETAMRDEADVPEAMAALAHGIAEARAAIDAMLRRS